MSSPKGQDLTSHLLPRSPRNLTTHTQLFWDQLLQVGEDEEQVSTGAWKHPPQGLVFSSTHISLA